MEKHFLHYFLNPSSVAFYGANNKGVGIASIQLMNLILAGYNGELYPIHLKLKSIMGFKAYKSIAELPEIPSLVIVVLPPKITPQIFEECGRKGVKNIVICSGGFREMIDDKENSLTEDLQTISKKYGMRFIGPNCLGFYNGYFCVDNKEKKKIDYIDDEKCAFNTSIWVKLKRGNFSIASQSGTLSSHIWFDPESLDVGLSKSLSVGNEADIDIVDCLNYFKNDESTQVIGIYIEEIKRGKRFLEIAKEITPKKPIIAIYVGGSDASNRALMSHTGSIAGNSRIYNAAFKKAGIIQTELVEEFLDIATLCSKGVFPKGKRIGILTNSGGPGVMLANHAEKKGLIIPEFSEVFQEKLKSMTSVTASVKNPLDCTFDMNLPNYYVSLPKVLMESGEIDIIIIYGVFDFPQILNNYLKNEVIYNNAEFKDSLNQEGPTLGKLLISPTIEASKKNSIPIIYINPQSYSNPWSKEIRKNGGTIFQLWDRPIRALAKLCDYALNFKNK